ncbi:hypothetical protein Nhal_1794 [Nitrosococcus halophilus Nc 4]|uniref:Uncharacterized protein n=1 Tax=Nitrosococcus halophilus (strain Nc4) TaxID=472759 RepID=D5C323_NITHN|nr:hypothetical protein Nhal_1794 [Nitrosococcus halophilus Nc 4]
MEMLISNEANDSILFKVLISLCSSCLCGDLLNYLG